MVTQYNAGEQFVCANNLIDFAGFFENKVYEIFKHEYKDGKDHYYLKCVESNQEINKWPMIPARLRVYFKRKR